MSTVHLDLKPLTPKDIPDPSTPAFAQFLDDHFSAGQKLADSIGDWKKTSVKCDGTVQIVTLNNHAVKKELGISEMWCGRISTHTNESVKALTHKLSTSTSKHNSHDHKKVEQTEIQRQADVMTTSPKGLYERFRRGLLEYHSENEREYIESMRETECLQVFQPHIAEVWRLTFKTPPPTNPRTFVVLLLSRELKQDPPGQRCFMNISLPFEHPDCPPKQGKEVGTVRGKYVSVERVSEAANGAEVDWRMATSSDAGGNIPRFITNSSLPSSIAEDVPSFLSWIERKFPDKEGGAVNSEAL